MPLIEAHNLQREIGDDAYIDEYTYDKWCVVYTPFRTAYFFTSRADWISYEKSSYEMTRLGQYPLLSNGNERLG